MASTNKTTNYELSQYVANDKPTYLVDYNSDMHKIDTQMKANNDLAGLAKTEADDLSSRVDGQDVIIGTLNTTVGQHTTDISSLNTDVSAINTKVGDLTDLNTTDKTDVVSAVNEVNTKVGDLTNLSTTNKSNIVNAVNELQDKFETDILWTNSNPTNAFVEQTLNIDLSSYNSIEIIFSTFPTGDFRQSFGKILVGYNGKYITHDWLNGVGEAIIARQVNTTSSSIEFKNAFDIRLSDGTVVSQTNTYLVPAIILGHK